VRCAAALLPLVLAACAAQPPGPAISPVPPASRAATVPGGLKLADPGFESEMPAARNCPLQWTCQVHVDPKSFRITTDRNDAAGGGQSLLIEKVGPEPWATVLQSVPAGEALGKRIRFTLAVRMEGVAGRGAGPWILLRGPSGVIEHKETLSTGSSGWRKVAVEVDVPPQTERIEVGAILEADGRLWVDDAFLEILPAAGGR
jgi:hypothetical protein